jgi:hypothetical protein
LNAATPVVAVSKTNTLSGSIAPEMQIALSNSESSVRTVSYQQFLPVSARGDGSIAIVSASDKNVCSPFIPTILQQSLYPSNHMFCYPATVFITYIRFSEGKHGAFL